MRKQRIIEAKELRMVGPNMHDRYMSTTIAGRANLMRSWLRANFILINILAAGRRLIVSTLSIIVDRIIRMATCVLSSHVLAESWIIAAWRVERLHVSRCICRMRYVSRCRWYCHLLIWRGCRRDSLLRSGCLPGF